MSTGSAHTVPYLTRRWRTPFSTIHHHPDGWNWTESSPPTMLPSCSKLRSNPDVHQSFFNLAKIPASSRQGHHAARDTLRLAQALGREAKSLSSRLERSPPMSSSMRLNTRSASVWWKLNRSSSCLCSGHRLNRNVASRRANASATPDYLPLTRLIWKSAMVLRSSVWFSRY